MSRRTRKAGRSTSIRCPFGEDLPGSERERVDGWWEALPARDRRHLVTLSDPRSESCAYHGAPRPDGSCAWYGVPIRVKGIFTDGDGGDEERFPVDLYEYVIAHEIVMIREQVFHVCTQHEAARTAIRAGRVPATFTCPLDRSGCPMRRLLALGRGQSLRFQKNGPAAIDGRAWPRHLASAVRGVGECLVP